MFFIDAFLQQAVAYLLGYDPVLFAIMVLGIFGVTFIALK